MFYQYKMVAEAFNHELLIDFRCMGVDGQYTFAQKHYAYELIEKNGIRSTSRILMLPRRTLQRWCRRDHVTVDRCPDWVYEWAERRRERRKRWSWRFY